LAQVPAIDASPQVSTWAAGARTIAERTCNEGFG
jgi:hypothetical protein